LPAFQQRRQVLAGTAHQQRQPAARADGGDSRRRQILVVRQRELCIWIDHVDQVMWCGGALSRRWLGSADIHAAIDLARVGRYDLTAQRPCQRDRQCRLAHRRRADDHKQRDVLLLSHIGQA
jgi:hypothetical protein